MPALPHFSLIMNEVLRQAALPLPEDGDPSVYNLYFVDEPALHVFPGADGQADVMTEAGRLPPSPSPSLLLSLLELNGFSGEAYAVGVSVRRGTETVVAWARQRIDTLDAAAMQRLLQCVRRQSAAIRERLAQCPPPGREGGNKAMARLLRMQAWEPEGLPMNGQEQS